MADEMWCGRRNEIGIASTFPGPDHWREELSSYRIGPTCSYCGSISPDKLFELIDAGAKIGPTDKSYKVYVEAPNPTPDELRYTGGGSANISEPLPGWKRERDLTPDEQVIAMRDGHRLERPDDWISFGPAGPISHGKFYFQHLDEAGQRRFIDLVNDKKINFGEPGYLYARPYFARPAAETVDA